MRVGLVGNLFRFGVLVEARFQVAPCKDSSFFDVLDFFILKVTVCGVYLKIDAACFEGLLGISVFGLAQPSNYPLTNLLHVAIHLVVKVLRVLSESWGC